MRPIVAVAVMVLIGLAWLGVSYASESFVATITTTDGGSMTVDAGLAGNDLALQCTADARYRACTSSTCFATSTDALVPGPGGSQVLVGPLFDFKMPRQHTHVAVRPTDGGTVSCNLYRVRGHTDYP